MSAWLFTGLAVFTLAALAALQFLRSRPDKVRVITSMFWNNSAKKAQARTLFEVFQNPLTYLLLALIALLTLLALANPIFGSKSELRYVVALEAGVSMTTDDERFQNAKDLVWAETGSHDEANVAVIVSDPYPRVIKQFDESLAMLKGRLSSITPAKTPISRDKLLNVSQTLLAESKDNEIVLVSAQPTSSKVQNVRILAAGEQTNNAFILSSVYVPAASAPDRGNLHYKIGYTGDKIATFNILLKNEDQVLSKKTVELSPGTTTEIISPDLIANGSLINISIDGPEQITSDSNLDFRLPDRRTITIVTENGFELPPVLSAIIKNLPSVTVGIANKTDQTALRIGPAGSGANIQVHAIKSNNESKHLVPVNITNHSLVSGLSFEDALVPSVQSGIKDPEGSQPLIMADNIILASLKSPEKQLNIANSLLDKKSSIVKRSGYFVFWSEVIHHLAGWTAEPLTLSPELNAQFTDTESSPIVMKASFNNFKLSSKGEVANPASSGSASNPAWQWILIIALILMSIEAVLHIRRKIT